MINTNKKALEHLKWRFNNGITPTAKDAEALNQLAGYVETTEREALQDNELFAKLYVAYLGELIKYYKATVYDTTPSRELHKVLDTPLKSIISTFVDSCNDIEASLPFEINGMLKHPREWTREEKAEIKMERGELTYKDAAHNLEHLINGAIAAYKTKKQ